MQNTISLDPILYSKILEAIIAQRDAYESGEMIIGATLPHRIGNDRVEIIVQVKRSVSE